MMTAAAATAGEALPGKSREREGSALRVLVFWSSYCASCKPLLEDLAEVRARFPAAPVHFYSVNTDDLDAVDVPQELRIPAPFKELGPQDELMRRYQVSSIPWVVITRCDGTLVATPSELNHPTSVPAYVEMELVFRGLQKPRVPAAIVAATSVPHRVGHGC